MADGHHNPETPGPPPTGDGPVLYEKRDRIAYVTINRPRPATRSAPSCTGR